MKCYKHCFLLQIFIEQCLRTSAAPILVQDTNCPRLGEFNVQKPAKHPKAPSSASMVRVRVALLFFPTSNHSAKLPSRHASLMYNWNTAPHGKQLVENLHFVDHDHRISVSCWNEAELLRVLATSSMTRTWSRRVQ